MKRLIATNEDFKTKITNSIENLNLEMLICGEIGDGTLTSQSTEKEVLDTLVSNVNKEELEPLIDELISDENEKQELKTFGEELLINYLKKNNYLKQFNEYVNFYESSKKNCYEQLRDKKDEIGDEVKTNKGYDKTDNRFVYYCGYVIVKHCEDHIKLVNELKDKIHKEKLDTPNYDFVTGKIDNDVAIIETSELNEQSIEAIAKDIMKQTGCIKVYSNENIGRDKEFKRIATKRLKKY